LLGFFIVYDLDFDSFQSAEGRGRPAWLDAILSIG
jgi:hypothetical protein